jgi:energy-coupling factor transporter ATP-binding protein EcfA2
VLVQPGVSPAQILGQAAKDLTALSEELQRDFDTALGFTPLGSKFDGAKPILDVKVEGPKGERTITLTERVIAAACRKGLGPLELLAHALVSPESLGDRWRPSGIGQARLPGGKRLEAQRKLYRLTDAAEDAERELTAGRHVLITGDAGSGRSALAAHFAVQYRNNNKGAARLDFSDSDDGPESVVLALLGLERVDEYLLVIDGLQTNPSVINNVFKCVKELIQTFGLDIRVLAIGEPAMAEFLGQGERILDLQHVRVDGAATIRQMLNDVDFDRASVRAEIERLAGDDVHIAASAVEFYKSHQVCPTELDLQREYTGDTQDPHEQRALYHLSCLGFFGLVMPIQEARESFGSCLRSLLDRELIRRTDTGYTIGPRRRAQLVIQHAQRCWTPRDRPEAIVWRRLQLEGGRAIEGILSRIDQMFSPDQLRPESLNLLATWNTAQQLAASLERRIDADPTWGDNLGAAVFAAMALARLRPDDTERWEKIASPIRARWRYGRELDRPEPVGQPTADFADFDEIQRQMEIEDQAFGTGGHPYDMRYYTFDRDKAYRNWVLGLLLGLESTAPARLREPARIRQLIELAGRACEPDGGFYPHRVPWVTARVVIGLCQAGLRNDHPVVAGACRWLRDQLGDADPLTEWWRSGTGSWNSDEATTAMCLTALRLANFPGQNATGNATAWLQSRIAHSMGDIDLANVLEALVLCTRSPIQPYLMELLNRMKLELRQPRTVEAGPEERLRIPFVTSQLASIVGQIVRTELRRLLGDVVGGQQDGGSDAGVPPEPPAMAASGVEIRRTEGLSPPKLELWRNECQRLTSTLADQINKRREKESIPSVHRALERLVEQREAVQVLHGELTGSAPREVFEKLDALGRQILGLAWPNNLPFPEIDDGPTHDEVNT